MAILAHRPGVEGVQGVLVAGAVQHDNAVHSGVAPVGDRGGGGTDAQAVRHGQARPFPPDGSHQVHGLMRTPGVRAPLQPIEGPPEVEQRAVGGVHVHSIILRLDAVLRNKDQGAPRKRVHGAVRAFRQEPFSGCPQEDQVQLSFLEAPGQLAVRGLHQDHGGVRIAGVEHLDELRPQGMDAGWHPHFTGAVIGRRTASGRRGQHAAAPPGAPP